MAEEPVCYLGLEPKFFEQDSHHLHQLIMLLIQNISN